jgi:uncharacterized membrane protein YphA (DoxX/SURF4 family)
MFAVAVILSVLLGLALVFLGTAKVIKHPKMVAKGQHLGFSPVAFQLVGVLELAGTAALLIGLLWTPLGITAAAGLVLLLIGGAIAHARVKDGFTAMAPALVGAAVSATTLVLLAVVTGPGS